MYEANGSANFNSIFRLDGKVALVTGGSRGLRLHTATAFLLAGAKKVIISARKAEGPQGINQAVKKLNRLPGITGKAIGIAANVANTEDIERLVGEIKKTDDKLDILVANAGATWGGPFEPTPDWSSKKVLDLNVRGVFNLARLYVKNRPCTPMLEAAGTKENPSRIIITSSTAGVTVPHVEEHGTIMYAVSKAAAHHLSRQLAVKLGPRNITTNTVAPGFFPSKLANGLIEILGEDIAGVMVFLCSPAGNYINGVDICVDGGVRLAQGRQIKL
ncbi:3-oxoacyl-acyl-carrier-protein reductase [Glonium stellatum]|uniref:3-oxoacyl-acyl-carrier-protein reductase n=1 Tax=Glonium stellatum TaxID=574774 RepID=A0A8E2F3H0_9PEZI|nr:3-oxoacyl-acyl-carrier-protein reductase [Glonium stellatum]